MNYLSRSLAGLVFLILVALLASSDQGIAAEFSADLVRSGDGDQFITKVYIKGQLRREEVMEDGDLSVVNIIRPDKGITWNLMPEEKMYMEIPIEGMDIGAMENMDGLESRAKMQNLGHETVNGIKCEKRRYDYHDRTQGSVTVWYSAKLEHPVKIHAKTNEGDMVMEYRNIKTGQVPDSKFEIPDGYQKFVIPGMPGGMMPGGMPPGMNQ